MSITQSLEINRRIYQHSNIILQNVKGNALWLGDYTAAENISQLNFYNIKTVITVTEKESISYDFDIAHYKFPIKDNKHQNIINYFEEINQLILIGLRRGSVLVHCGSGVSRSASFIIAYLMKYNNFTFQEALNYCKKKRPEICPNLGFQRQLKLYEISLNTKKLKQKQTNSRNNLPIQSPKLFPPIQNQNHLDIKLKNPLKKFKISKIQSRGIIKKPSLVIPGFNENYLRKMAQFRFGITLGKIE